MKELTSYFTVSSENCPIIKFALADYRSSIENMSPYSGTEFTIDEDQNLLLDTSKEGTFKAKITPDMNKNYAYLDIEMKILPDVTPNYLNIAPHFI